MASTSATRSRPSKALRPTRIRLSIAKVRQAMDRLGLSQADLERSLIISGDSGRLDRFFCGKGGPSLERGVRVARALDCQVEDLIEEVRT